jgi:hypothetical protein
MAKCSNRSLLHAQSCVCAGWDASTTRIFPLAPAPLLFAGIGFALSGASILPRVFARTAVLVSGLFLIAGLAAVFATAGLILAIVMSVVEAVWIAAAAIALARTTAHARP